MSNPNVTKIKLSQTHIESNMWKSNFNSKQPSSLDVRFNNESLKSALKYLSSNPLIKGVLIPADIFVDEDSYLSVEDDYVLVSSNELRAEFTDGHNGTLYSVKFNIEVIEYENRLRINGKISDLLKLRKKLLSALDKPAYPDWPEYTKRKYNFKVDFKILCPIPKAAKAHKLDWQEENWGTKGNAKNTLITNLIDTRKGRNHNENDFIDLCFDTSGIPRPYIKTLIDKFPSLDFEYFYYADSSFQIAGTIKKQANGSIFDKHYVDHPEVDEISYMFGIEE